MLLKADASALEWRVKAYLSQDQIAIPEILEGIKTGTSIHTINQKTLGLPSKLIAKIFAYRMIFADAFGEKGFAGPAYAYANDPDFQGTSKSVKFWQGIVTKFFEKYRGMYDHSVQLIREATTNGKIVSPSGRTWDFYPKQTYRGIDWPRTEILNYPVQGLAADFMQLARNYLFERLQVNPIYRFGDLTLIINTVHDDIEEDVDNDLELVYNNCILLEEVFSSIPRLFKKTYGVEVNVPMGADCKFGWSLSEKEMIPFNRKTFSEDWEKIIKIGIEQKRIS